MNQTLLGLKNRNQIKQSPYLQGGHRVTGKKKRSWKKIALYVKSTRIDIEVRSNDNTMCVSG